MGHSFLYARQNTGLIWHTTVRPSVRPSTHRTITSNQKEGTLGWVNMGNDLTRELVFLSLPTTSWSYFYSPGFRRVTLLESPATDNISHLFPLLLTGHVVTYVVLIKGGASERCDFGQFGKRQFSYGIYN
jgi:hypothetical protein